MSIPLYALTALIAAAAVALTAAILRFRGRRTSNLKTDPTPQPTAASPPEENLKIEERIAEIRSTILAEPPSTEEKQIPAKSLEVRRIDLKLVKGIGRKREEKLKSIGVATLEDLAGYNPAELASKLGVSEKTASRWVEEAKSLLQEA